MEGNFFLTFKILVVIFQFSVVNFFVFLGIKFLYKERGLEGWAWYIFSELETDEHQEEDFDDVSAPNSLVEKMARGKEADNDFYNVIEKTFMKVPEEKQGECFFSIRRLIRNTKKKCPTN